MVKPVNRAGDAPEAGKSEVGIKAERGGAAAPVAPVASPSDEKKPADDGDDVTSTTENKVELLIQLPEKYNTPDGRCRLPDNSVLVSVPNVND